MQHITILFILLLSVACNTTKFKVGDCVQKPDSMRIYQVSKLGENQITLVSKSDSFNQALTTTSMDWIKTKCPEFTN